MDQNVDPPRLSKLNIVFFRSKREHYCILAYYLTVDFVPVSNRVRAGVPLPRSCYGIANYSSKLKDLIIISNWNGVNVSYCYP